MEGFDGYRNLNAFSEFMSIISDAFPNWQEEYEALNELYLHDNANS